VGGEADHSPPCSAEVKYARSYTSTTHYVFMAWYLVKHRDNFTFLPLLSPETLDTPSYVSEANFE
jgi:hypothetical protein